MCISKEVLYPHCSMTLIKTPPLNQILSHSNLIYLTNTYFFKIHFNIILQHIFVFQVVTNQEDSSLQLCTAHISSSDSLNTGEMDITKFIFICFFHFSHINHIQTFFLTYYFQPLFLLLFYVKTVYDTL
jgi:hypothetical protein